jgi:nucleoid-associated protein YgaU
MAGALRIGGIAVAVLLAAGAGWWAMEPGPPLPVPPPQPRAALPEAPVPGVAPAPTPPPAAEAARPAAPPIRPSFDVVRVGQRGTAVVAGRSAPGAEIVLRAGARELGRARADARGEWVILPASVLGPGAYELSLLARGPDGTEIAGEDVALVVVPDAVLAAAAPPAAPAREAPRPASAAPDVGGVAQAVPAEAAPPAAPAAAAPLVALLPAAGAPRLLQGAEAAAPARPAAARLGLDIVDYDEAGGMRFAGTAPPGAAVRVYVNQGLAGDALADAQGRWALTPAEPPAVGRHTLRLDQITAAGGVAARVELPFQRDPVSPEAFEGGRVVVQPGNSLWRIARTSYGRGARYTVIYAANREHIRDPRRIYPGQVFAVPALSDTPAASSRSR